MHLRYSVAFAALVGGPAFGAGLTVHIEVPRLTTAEYHRPYVAAWIERPDQSVAATLAVWYDVQNKGKAKGESSKWLKDMRQWWRRIGRELQMPIDGVSSATRPVGKHQISLVEGTPALPKLVPGAYKLYVEAVREAGGREVVNLPFQWPPSGTEQSQVIGNSELGTVKLELNP